MAEFRRKLKEVIDRKVKENDKKCGLVRHLTGEEFNIASIQKHGFLSPIFVENKAGLGLQVPGRNFSVTHVKKLVGSHRFVDVMDLDNQINRQMTVEEWCRYYSDDNREKVLRANPVEFSDTALDEYVQSPVLVRQIDWVETVWPPSLKKTHATPEEDEMLYPQVQKYCQMSVKGCYTDFHMEFGGSSVWFHLHTGAVIFCLIPPTKKNCTCYENWALDGKTSDVFFGDVVDKCSMIELMAGNTLFIPSGWIYAAFTSEDSVAFSGCFLHSFSIQSQLKVVAVENVIHVPKNLRYPLLTEMLWYVLCKYVLILLRRNYLDEELNSLPPSGHVHLTAQELHGIKDIVLYLHNLRPYQKNVPRLLVDPIALFKDVRTVIELHRRDNPALAITGRNALTGVGDDEREEKKDFVQINSSSSQRGQGKPTGARGLRNTHGGPRRRRTRCKKCAACRANDCGTCSYCLDMVKFGGSGRAKQTCVVRQCLEPTLPVTSTCFKCDLDGWGELPEGPNQKKRDKPSALMECSSCFEIAHPACYAQQHTDGTLNLDLPNSWVCPTCCENPSRMECKPRHFKARQKLSEVMQQRDA